MRHFRFEMLMFDRFRVGVLRVAEDVGVVDEPLGRPEVPELLEKIG